MRLPRDLGWLTYCLNIHPTQNWAETRAALTGPMCAVRDALGPDEPFAAGLRFSAETVRELESPRARSELKSILADNRLLPVTVNGFPYGPFHGTRVKEDVYQPDWRSDARLDYTCSLADLMADISAAGEVVSLSTVPGTFKPLAAGAEANMVERLLRTAAHLSRLREVTGVTVALALEPEPFCFLETIEEAVAFFDAFLFSEDAVRRMGDLAGLDRNAAAIALPRHLGLCYDVCHAAVEFEDAAGSIAALRVAGVPIHKLQLSAALRLPSVTQAARKALRSFDEPTYLHQVVSRRGNGPLRREPDLPTALARAEDADGEEWRVHFHVPVFLADLGDFYSTQDFLAEILTIHAREPISAHLEVETYTWDVLPKALRHGSVEANVARELRWVLERLGA
ncbi:metabolite traffic protein EboE [Aurantimonas sp. C2-6-R+9]|uniref:metabolite traffic protein EboE n=1 Tax=unclassified Aurantimonas TaxID=2638230 RepID=UPI002E18846C|nr:MULTISPECIES: metabolite traffic protein EboE [unclassified Aurantimonas]MEC5292275.1 metabolite traffic protein EboE [Aurantimonas sp. C2-3-R2]MEC5382490.1 metabolite traffic protein EboE [Aurantimonas sp. C2-6-R+9]MEC5413360.1 metabolite traffic protein EboE [Aurantimonas sp. C2-4-R8]